MNSLLLQAVSEYLELSLRRENELVKENAILRIKIRSLERRLMIQYTTGKDLC